MSDLNLKAEQRNITGRKVSQLRREGLVPVVVYGACLLYTSPSPRD